MIRVEVTPTLEAALDLFQNGAAVGRRLRRKYPPGILRSSQRPIFVLILSAAGLMALGSIALMNAQSTLWSLGLIVPGLTLWAAVLAARMLRSPARVRRAFD